LFQYDQDGTTCFDMIKDGACTRSNKKPA